MPDSDAFTPLELRKLRALKTPAGVQHFLDGIPYHLAGTAWSPRKVLREKTARCLEGATLRRPRSASSVFRRS